MNLSFLLLGAAALNFGEVSGEVLPWDGRIERAEYVSSLIKPGDVGLEIGVQYGLFAYHVLLHNQPSKLYLVDPWTFGIQGYEVPPSFAGNMVGENEYDIVRRVFKPCSHVEILKMTSDEAAGLFPNDYFDYVYVDAKYSYTAVKIDLTNYFPKVKVGGYIIGDDYGWTGITDAVQEFISLDQDELVFLDDPYCGRAGGQFAIGRIK